MIRFFIKIYIFIIILDSILSYFPQVRHQEWARTIRKLSNLTLDPVRRILPRDLPVDLSPMVVIILFNLLMLLW